MVSYRDYLKSGKFDPTMKKVGFEKNQQTTKNMQNYQVGKT